MKTKSLFLLLALTFTSFQNNSYFSTSKLSKNSELNIVDSFEGFYSDTTNVSLSGDSLELVRYYDSSGSLNMYKLKMFRPNENITEIYRGLVGDTTINWDSDYTLIHFNFNSKSISSLDIVSSKNFGFSNSYLNDLVSFADSVSFILK